jgi:hypothetical protein
MPSFIVASSVNDGRADKSAEETADNCAHGAKQGACEKCAARHRAYDLFSAGFGPGLFYFAVLWHYLKTLFGERFALAIGILVSLGGFAVGWFLIQRKKTVD